MKKNLLLIGVLTVIVVLFAFTGCAPQADQAQQVTEAAAQEEPSASESEEELDEPAEVAPEAESDQEASPEEQTAEQEPSSDSFHFESKGIEVTITEITQGMSDKDEPYVAALFEVTNHNEYDYKPWLVSTYLQLEDGTASDGSGFNGDTDLDFATQNFEANTTKTGVLAWHFKDVENIVPGRAEIIDFKFTEDKPEEEKDGPFVSSVEFEDMYFEFK